MQKQYGFTVIEMMITLAIIGILVAAAGPGYQDFVANSRMNAQSSEFLTGMQYARSEAIKRNATVSICKSSNGSSCAASGTWSQGWIIFVDGGTTGTVDGGDIILRAHEALSGGVTMVGTTAVASVISYQSNGMAAQAGQLDMCNSRQNIAGRDIIVTTGTGKPVLQIDNMPLTCS